MGNEFKKEEKLNKEGLENQVEVTEEMPEKEDYEQELTRIIKSDAPDTVKLEQIDDYHERTAIFPMFVDFSSQSSVVSE